MYLTLLEIIVKYWTQIQYELSYGNWLFISIIAYNMDYINITTNKYIALINKC